MNQTISSAAEKAANQTIGSAAEKAANQTIGSAAEKAANQTIGSAAEKTVNQTIGSTSVKAVNQTSSPKAEGTVNRTISIAPVHKTIVVQASPERAFEVFTAGIDRWWPKAKGIGATPIRQSVIEPFVGGRWYTTHEDGSKLVIGHVGVWQPPERFVVSWEISAAWKPDARAALASEVEVRFVREADGFTRVELDHRNFERMGAEAGATMRNGVDNGWPGMLELFAKEASAGAAA